jgi:hypothetical protein
MLMWQIGDQLPVRDMSRFCSPAAQAYRLASAHRGSSRIIWGMKSSSRRDAGATGWIRDGVLLSVG